MLINSCYINWLTWQAITSKTRSFFLLFAVSKRLSSGFWSSYISSAFSQPPSPEFGTRCDIASLPRYFWSWNRSRKDFSSFELLISLFSFLKTWEHSTSFPTQIFLRFRAGVRVSSIPFPFFRYTRNTRRAKTVSQKIPPCSCVCVVSCVFWFLLEFWTLQTKHK